MHVIALTIELNLPGCNSLKDKRRRIKPLLNRLNRQFNVSTAEIDHNDRHSSTVIACVVVSNDSRHAQRVVAKIPGWIARYRPDLQVIDEMLTVL
jgi:uncharacterized protein YlxP (DUF503 family)